MIDVAIVGGGIAGLATAYELHRRGVSFRVLEESGRPGGVILSEEIDGFTVDAGPDALLVQKPDAIALCREIGLGDRLVPTRPPRIAYIQRGGRLHPLPAASVLGIPTRIAPFLTTRLFSWAGKIRMGAELFVPARQDDEDESIGAFMTRRFGREAATYLAEPLLAGIHAGDVDRLSVLSLFPRFRQVERTHGSLLRGFRQHMAAQADSRSHSDGPFRSLPGGLSEMVRALVGVLPAGSIQLRAPVTAIRGTAPFHLETAGAGEPVTARAVVVATPASATARILREVDAEVSALCDQVPYASTGTVVLAFPRAAVGHPLNGSGYVVPRVEDAGILAVSWLSSKWPHRAPDDHVLLRTFVGGARDPRALDENDAELIRRSLDAIRPLLMISGDPILARVYRWNRASAQHEVGHARRLAAIERGLARHAGLFVTGSGFRGVGIPDCIADGRATAKQVAEWLAAAPAALASRGDAPVPVERNG